MGMLRKLRLRGSRHDDEALDLLEQFCERFYWINDHPDYQKAVREFLARRGRHARPYGHP